jgi:hypothetical protein
MGATACIHCPAGTFDDISHYPSDITSCKPCSSLTITFPLHDYSVAYCAHSVYTNYGGGDFNAYRRTLKAPCGTVEILAAGDSNSKSFVHLGDTKRIAVVLAVVVVVSIAIVFSLTMRRRRERRHYQQHVLAKHSLFALAAGGGRGVPHRLTRQPDTLRHPHHPHDIRDHDVGAAAIGSNPLPEIRNYHELIARSTDLEDLDYVQNLLTIDIKSGFCGESDAEELRTHSACRARELNSSQSPGRQQANNQVRPSHSTPH